MTNELEMNRLRHKILTMLPFEERMYIQPLLDKCLMFANGESRPQGEWLWLGFDDGNSHKWSCSLCGRGVENQENFCPNCGADMRGDKR